MIFYPLTGDIFTTFSVTLLFQVGIHRLKEEFTRFEFTVVRAGIITGVPV